MISFARTQTSMVKKVISSFVAFTFIFTSILPPSLFAQGLPVMLPAPGVLVMPSVGYVPTLIRGITVNPQNPLNFTFYVSKGDQELNEGEVRAESDKLIKYFLATLTTPSTDLWVNLSPLEKDRMITPKFGITEMGRDLLAQDYVLKQLSSSLMYPENELGQDFWARVHEKAYERFGTTEIPVDTFNKIWIIPNRAAIYEHEGSAFVVQSDLKVMMASDYLALQKSIGRGEHGLSQVGKQIANEKSDLVADIIRDVLIPEIEKEVNEGETFANLRQIYHSMILATWFKNNLKETLLGQVYVNKNKVAGVNVDDPQVKEKIYQQYLKAYKLGVYNYIKEEYDEVAKKIIPRQYYSGGAGFQGIDNAVIAETYNDISLRYAPIEVVRGAQNIAEDSAILALDVDLYEADPLGKNVAIIAAAVEQAKTDSAMLASEVQTGVDYWNQLISSTPITRPFRESRKEDVDDITEIDEEYGRQLEAIAIRSLLQGEGYIATMIAGGSTRMNVKDAPEEVAAMVQGEQLLSKAAVPIGEIDGQVVTYLDAFGQNLARLFKEIDEEAKRAGVASNVYDNIIGLLSNDQYRPEHNKLLKRSNYFGLDQEQIRIYHQPLGTIYVGTPEDVLSLKDKLDERGEGVFEDALELSKKAQARLKAGDERATVLKGEQQPLGHGEFLHQLVASGELLNIIFSNKKWVFTKNIDNYAAKFDKVWLRTVGLFLSKQQDFQPEVSPRAPGMKGGNLLHMEDTKAHQLAETPNIEASILKLGIDPSVLNSYWFNDAVGLMSVDYIIDIYKKDGQSREDFVAELKAASTKERGLIADRGRQKFPKLVDAKPAKTVNAVAVKVETNLWQSSGIVSPELAVEAVGVRSARNFPINDYGKMTIDEKMDALANLRFLATKQWDVTASAKQKAKENLEELLGRKVTKKELDLTLESYDGNKLLAPDLLRYIRSAELVTPGILEDAALLSEAQVDELVGIVLNPDNRVESAFATQDVEILHAKLQRVIPSALIPSGAPLLKQVALFLRESKKVSLDKAVAELEQLLKDASQQGRLNALTDVTARLFDQYRTGTAIETFRSYLPDSAQIAEEDLSQEITYKWGGWSRDAEANKEHTLKISPDNTLTLTRYREEPIVVKFEEDEGVVSVRTLQGKTLTETVPVSANYARLFDFVDGYPGYEIVHEVTVTRQGLDALKANNIPPSLDVTNMAFPIQQVVQEGPKTLIRFKVDQAQLVTERVNLQIGKNIATRDQAKSNVRDTHPHVVNNRSLNVLQKVAGLTEEINELNAQRNQFWIRRVRSGEKLSFPDPEDYIQGTDIKWKDAWSGNFRTSPVQDDYLDRRSELTGPATIKPTSKFDPNKGIEIDAFLASNLKKDFGTITYQLLSGAKTMMFDGEDALGSKFTMSLDNIQAITLAFDALDNPNSPYYDLFWETAESSFNKMVKKGYHDVDFDWKSALLNIDTKRMFRHRGPHLKSREFQFTNSKGKQEGVSATIADIVMYVTSVYETFQRQGSSIMLYSPKLQTAAEAAWLKKVINAVEDELGLRRGTVRTTVLIEQIQEVYEIEGIRAALGENFAGFNTGRWDYIADVVKQMYGVKDWVAPNFTQQHMGFPYMRNYEQMVLKSVNLPGRIVAKDELKAFADLSDAQMTELIAKGYFKEAGFSEEIKPVQLLSVQDKYLNIKNHRKMSVAGLTLEQRDKLYQALTVHWIGGMEANIPTVREDLDYPDYDGKIPAEEAARIAQGQIAAAQKGKEGEMSRGAGGFWMAHWLMGKPLWETVQKFYSSAKMKGRVNQLGMKVEPIQHDQASADKLIELDEKVIRTKEEFRKLVSIMVYNLNAELTGRAAVASKSADEFLKAQVGWLMDDRATTEGRAKLVRDWVKKGAVFTNEDGELTGEKASEAMFLQILQEEYDKLRFDETGIVLEDSKSNELVVAEHIARKFITNRDDTPLTWTVDLVNIALDFDTPEEAIEQVDRYISVYNQSGGLVRLVENPHFEVAEELVADAALLAVEFKDFILRNEFTGISRLLVQEAKEIHQSLTEKGIIDADGKVVSDSLPGLDEEDSVIIAELGIDGKYQDFAKFILGVLTRAYVPEQVVQRPGKTYSELLEELSVDQLQQEQARVAAQLAIEQATGVKWDQEMGHVIEDYLRGLGRKSTAEWIKLLRNVEVEVATRPDQAMFMDGDAYTTELAAKLHQIDQRRAILRESGVEFDLTLGSDASLLEQRMGIATELGLVTGAVNEQDIQDHLNRIYATQGIVADVAMLSGLEHPTLFERARVIEEGRRRVREEEGRYINYPHTAYQIAATTAPIENDLRVTRYAGSKYTREQRENFRRGKTSGTYGVTNQVEAEAVARSGRIMKALVTDQDLAEILGLDAPLNKLFDLREDLRNNGYLDENNVVTDEFLTIHPEDMKLDGNYNVSTALIFSGVRRVIWNRVKSIYQGGWAEIMKYFGASDQAKEPMTYLSIQPAEMSTLLISHARHQEAAISLMGLSEKDEVLFRASDKYYDFYIPIMMDIDHGHGKPQQLIQANLTVGRDGLLVATVHIEDQCKKKCGHMPRKSLVTTKDWLEAISAVRQQLDAMGLFEVSIVHRTDAEDAHIISGDDDGRDQMFIYGLTNYLNKETLAAARADAEKEVRETTAKRIKAGEITEKAAPGVISQSLNISNLIMDSMIDENGRLMRYHPVITHARDKLGLEDKDLALVDSVWKKLAGRKVIDKFIEETIVAQGENANITVAEWHAFLQTIPREYGTDYIGIVKKKAREIGIMVYNKDEWELLEEISPNTFKNGYTHIMWDHNAAVTHSDGNHFWMIQTGVPMAIARNSAALDLGDSPWMEQKKAFILESIVWAMALDQRSVDILIEQDFWKLLDEYGDEFKSTNGETVVQLLRDYLIARRLAPEDSFLKTRDDLVELGVTVETAVHLINSVSRPKSNNTSPSFRWPFAQVGISSEKLQGIIDDILKFQPSFKHVATKAADFAKIWDDTYASFGLKAEPVLDVERNMTDDERKNFLSVQGRDVQKQFSTYFGEVKNHVLSQLFLEGYSEREAEDKVREILTEIFKNGFINDEMYVVSKLQELGYAIDNAFTDNSQVFAGVVYDTIREATGKGEAVLFKAYGGASDTQGKSVSELAAEQKIGEAALAEITERIDRARSIIQQSSLTVDLLKPQIVELHIWLVAQRTRLKEYEGKEILEALAEKEVQIQTLLDEAIDKMMSLEEADEVAFTLEDASLDHMEERFEAIEIAYADAAKGLSRDIFILRSGQNQIDVDRKDAEADALPALSQKEQRISALLTTANRLLSDVTDRAMLSTVDRQALESAQPQIATLLQRQYDAGAITDVIFNQAISNTYQNLELWTADEDIHRLSPALRESNLAAIREGRWNDLIEAYRQEIAFGTAGIRGKAVLSRAELLKLKSDGPTADILKGPNTINDIVLLIKTAGLIRHMKANGEKKVVIGYDSRLAGNEFADMIARLFLAQSTPEHEFKIFMFDEAAPFPELSYGITVDQIKANKGVFISASHNPAEYNGYKITRENGAQLNQESKDNILDAVAQVKISDIVLADSIADAKKGQVVWLGGDTQLEGKDYHGFPLLDLHTQHIEQNKRFILDKDLVARRGSDVKIGFAAFNGAGYKSTPRLLTETGFTSFKVISKLQELDGTFPAFNEGEQPDPGDPIAADVAVEEFIAEHGQAAFDELDILFGTDPDADRMGAVVRVPKNQQDQFGKYTLLSANDVWTLLTWYRLMKKKELGQLENPDDHVVAFSHVTTDAIEAVAGLFGVKAVGDMMDKTGTEKRGNYLNGRRTWVGFTYIAEVFERMINAGKQVEIGAEESNGMSLSGHVNDKDGTLAVILVSEVAAYAKQNNTNIFELLDNIYQQIGHFATANKALPRIGSFEGAAGVSEKINILKRAQEWGQLANEKAGTAQPFTIGGQKVIGAIEFKSGRIDHNHYEGVPDEGVRFFFEDESVKDGDPFTKSKNYITIRPSGTSQTLRFYTQIFSELSAETDVAVSEKARNYFQAQEVALLAQRQILTDVGLEKYIGAVKDQLTQMGSDQAMTVRQREVGGIDFNPALLDLQIKRDGKGIPLPLPQQPIEALQNIEGFIPVIINTTPVTNMPLILGLKDDVDVDDPIQFGFDYDHQSEDPQAKLDDEEHDLLSLLR